MKISCEPIANLVNSTSGTGSDWVVKRIDVYPVQIGTDAVMGGLTSRVAACSSKIAGGQPQAESRKTVSFPVPSATVPWAQQYGMAIWTSSKCAPALPTPLTSPT
jgi:hypothetical protein